MQKSDFEVQFAYVAGGDDGLVATRRFATCKHATCQRRERRATYVACAEASWKAREDNSSLDASAKEV